jgi:hypothetical protein
MVNVHLIWHHVVCFLFMFPLLSWYYNVWVWCINLCSYLTSGILPTVMSVIHRMNIKHYRIAYDLIKLAMASLKYIKFYKRLVAPTSVLLRIQVCWDVKLCCWFSVVLPFTSTHLFSTLGNTNPAAQCYITEDMNSLYTSLH